MKVQELVKKKQGYQIVGEEEEAAEKEDVPTSPAERVAEGSQSWFSRLSIRTVAAIAVPAAAPHDSRGLASAFRFAVIFFIIEAGFTAWA